MIKQEVCFRENIACEGVIQGQVNRTALPPVSFLKTGFQWWDYHPFILLAG